MLCKKLLCALLISTITMTTMPVLPSIAAADTLPNNEKVKRSMADKPINEHRQHPELIHLHNEINETDNLNQARALALEQTNAAIDALKHARAIMPLSKDLRLAETRLLEAHTRIESADSPQQVANEFSGMMIAGLDNDQAATLKVGKVGCDYSTGEIIAIVVGLILGIIPGIILLIVLC